MSSLPAKKSAFAGVVAAIAGPIGRPGKLGRVAKVFGEADPSCNWPPGTADQTASEGAWPGSRLFLPNRGYFMDDLPTLDFLRDIDRRQDDLLDDLEHLNRRIQDVLDQHARASAGRGAPTDVRR